MKLTSKQRRELEVLRWFADSTAITDADIKRYFAYSDKGVGKTEALRALTQPKDLPAGFVALMAAKQNRDAQVKMWMEDWGDTLNAWSFIDEPQHITEWIAKILDREAIIMAWHEEKYRWWNPFSWKHKKIAAHYQKIIDTKLFNKSLQVRRSEK